MIGDVADRDMVDARLQIQRHDLANDGEVLVVDGQRAARIRGRIGRGEREGSQQSQGGSEGKQQAHGFLQF